MFEFFASYIYIIAIVLVTFAILFLFAIVRKLSKEITRLMLKNDDVSQLIDADEEAFNQFKASIAATQQNQSAELKEVNEVTRHLEHRVAQLQQLMTEQNQLIQGIQSQAPEDKLYSRAQKMVALGADAEELMTECELPRAEAEMLVAMHQRKKT